MRLFKKIKEAIFPWKKKKRLHNENLQKQLDEGKYLRVGEDVDNKEVIKNGKK